MRSQFPVVACAALSALALVSCHSSSDMAQSADGPIHRRELLSKVFEINRRYKSMEGPWEQQNFQVDPDRDELVWIKGFQTEIVDPENKGLVSQEFMCHMNIDAFPQEHLKYMDATFQSSRVVSLSQGLMKYMLPDGYGVPVHSKEILSLTTQVLNHNFDGDFHVRHRVSVFYLPQSEAKRSIKPVYFSSSFVMQRVSGPDGFFQSADGKDCPCCKAPPQGRHAKNATTTGLYRDTRMRMFTGHWVVPLGKEVTSTPLRNLMSVPFDTRIHGILAHTHPFAKSVDLLEIDPATCERKLVYRSNIECPKDRVGISHIDSYSDPVGIPFRADRDYEMVSTYQNDTGQEQDSMASMFFFLEDKAFRPKVPMGTALAQAAPEAAAPAATSTALKLPDAPVLGSKSGDGKDALHCGLEVKGNTMASATMPAMGSTAAAPAATDPAPDLTPDKRRVRFMTKYGPLVFELYPKLAPKHVEQILKLVEGKVFDKSPIIRIEKNFIVQFGGTWERTSPLTAEQAALVKNIPGEFSPSLKHARGLLSMARYDDPNSATTSFSIMLAPAPHLDGKYTIFGKLVAGEETLRKLEQLPVNDASNHRPLKPVEVISARVIDRTLAGTR